jgi:hypothetical protein
MQFYPFVLLLFLFPLSSNGWNINSLTSTVHGKHSVLSKIPMNDQGFCTERFRTGRTPLVPILALSLNYV